MEAVTVPVAMYALLILLIWAMLTSVALDMKAVESERSK